ncbi:MAG: hypothetical protein KDC71_23685 [Acidobacteria bacterium]|nr:hypothetical protein [Acidobacteriota bacterium]
MRAINLSDPEGKDSPVGFEPKGQYREVEYRAADGSLVIPITFIKSTMASRYEALLEQVGGDIDALTDQLIAGDPEISLEYSGKITSGKKTVFLMEGGKIAFAVQFEEQRYSPAGELISAQPQKWEPSNVSESVPLVWTGKYIPYSKAIRQFVFTKIYQIQHMNGLTYAFLFNMAKILHDKQSFMLIGAGPGGKEPLRFNRGAPPYRGFLKGRVEGESYCLSLHLSNMELKAHEGFYDAAESE